ncbi:MAG TPA: hypothetical protein P5558_16800, partial [Geminicoccaceae bacterium]|nr:hypothetical protein [Geminicoccaceae bacterium]
ADPEEELNIYLTPRDDGGFERFKHYPDQAPVIADLCERMAAEAARIGDAEGLDIIGEVQADIAPRLKALGR